jgi:4-carboxymuconolactone decarboxylase
VRNQLLSFALVLSLVAGAGVQAAETRMAPIPPEKYDAAQKKAVADFEAIRKAPISGPWIPLLRSPELMSTTFQLGQYVRYKLSIGPQLTDFTVLVVGRMWAQDFEWSIHGPQLVKSGVSQDIVDALAEGRRPDGMSEDQALCYDFTVELQHNKRVSDATYAKAVKRFGENGVIDLVGLNGYYTLLAMTFNTARIASPDGKKLPRFPD